VSILWAVAENLSENDSNLLKNDMSPKPPQIGKFAVALALAFMRDDTKEMEGLVSAAISSPESQDIIFASQSDTEAFHGHLRNARDFLLKAVNSARQDGAIGRWQAHAALWEELWPPTLVARRYCPKR
jgi:hypothetical protein